MHLCRAGAAGHNFFFFGAVGEGNIEVEVQEAGTVLLILGTMLGEGRSARIRAARPSHYLWPPGCSGRERRVRRLQ